MRELTSEELVQYNELQSRINDRLMTQEEFANWLDNSYRNPRIQEIEDRLLEIQKYYDDHDYYPHKIARGEWLDTDPRWVDYVAKCSTLKNEKDTLIAELNGLNV